MDIEKYITSPYNKDEAAYVGNLGFTELCKFWDLASTKEKDEMDKILKKEDWFKFKKLINKVVGVQLQ